MAPTCVDVRAGLGTAPGAADYWNDEPTEATEVGLEGYPSSGAMAGLLRDLDYVGLRDFRTCWSARLPRRASR